jgi:hypothetical protein
MALCLLFSLGRSCTCTRLRQQLSWGPLRYCHVAASFGRTTPLAAILFFNAESMVCVIFIVCIVMYTHIKFLVSSLTCRNRLLALRVHSISCEVCFPMPMEPKYASHWWGQWYLPRIQRCMFGGNACGCHLAMDGRLLCCRVVGTTAHIPRTKRSEQKIYELALVAPVIYGPSYRI